MIANDKLFNKVYKCHIKKCYYETKKKSDISRHITAAHEKKISSKQEKKGDPESMLQFGVRKGIIPPQYSNFRQRFLAVFDIEALEQEFLGKKEGMDRSIEMIQKVVSLAVGTNIPGSEPTFFCRTSSQPEAEEELIRKFIDHLGELHEKLQENLPE